MVDDPRGERGSGTVLVLALVMLVGLLLAVAALFVGVTAARHRAGAAADLSALAAAAVHPAPEACATAARVAAANAGRIGECRVSADGSVLVTVVVAVTPRWPGGPARASARAGPGTGMATR